MTDSHHCELDVLAAGCRELGTELTGTQYEHLLAYLDQLYVWNRLAGLTNIPRENAVRLHVLDSIAALPFMASGSCLDIGTGAGLPGLVLAVADPSRKFVLVESNRKRCSFLSETAHQLSLKNVEVVQSDIRQLVRGRHHATVISRAFRPPLEFLAIARDYVGQDGHVILLMADPEEPELRALENQTGFHLENLKRFRLPVGREPRTIVCLRPDP